MSGIESFVSLAEKLGILERVKDKLIKQPDPASDKLVTVLEELAKMFETLNSEISRYLSVTFYEEQNFKERAEERAHLVELEGGQISARMARARGHCSKITGIYSKYLSTWFDSVLTSEESYEMEELFRTLSDVDVDVIMAIDHLSDWLSQKAENTLNFVDNEEFSQADKIIKEARREILPKRKALAAGLVTLFDLQAEFVEVSGAL